MNVKRLGFSAMVLLTLLVTLSGSACKHKDDSKEQEIEAEIELIEDDINAIIGRAACENSNQCGYVEMGSKPCGGPMTFKIYSSLNTDTTLLFEKAAKHVELSEELNRLTGAISTCSVEQPPTVSCQAVCLAD